MEEQNLAGVIKCDLLSWHACVMDRVGDTYAISKVSWSTNKPGFWRWVKHNLHERKTVWAIGFSVAFQLGLTGFWELLEDEEWTLSGTERCEVSLDQSKPSKLCVSNLATAPKRTEDGMQSSLKESYGICVIQDPPTIVMATPDFGRRTVKILDLRNYGVNHPVRTSEGYIDVNAMAQWISGWCRTLSDNKLGGLQTTAASQAMHSYKFAHMPEIMKVHNNQDALTLERDSLHCGRNECFKVGMVHGPVYHLDFNSFYGAIARDAQCPARFIEYGECDAEGLQVMIAKGYCVFADVMIGCHEPIYPKRIDDRLTFPIGTFRTTLAHPEVLEAIERESIIKVYSASIYETDNLFRSWVDTMFSIRHKCRQAGDIAGEETAKRLMVSVFGKFAQWSRPWVSVNGIDPPSSFCEWWEKRPEIDKEYESYASETNRKFYDGTREKGGYCRWRSIGWHVMYEGVRYEHNQSMPAIPSYIYSLARIKLIEAIRMAGWENVFYCDADSIWTNHTGMKTLERCGMLHDEELGKLKLKEVWPWVKFYGLKHYETPGKITHAGVPDYATQVGERVWEFQSSERIAGALSQDRAPKPMLIRKRLDYRKQYQHGNVAINGSVTPIVLNERW